MKRLWIFVIGHLSSHSALSNYGLFVPLAFRRLSCLSTTSGPDPGELPGLWGSMVFRHAPTLRKGSGNNNMLSLGAVRLEKCSLSLRKLW